MVSGNRDNCILESKKKPLGKTSPPLEGLGEASFKIKETPFSNREGRFFVMKRAFLQFDKTPSLFANNGLHSPPPFGEGLGGEAFLHLQTAVFTPLSIRRGGGGEAVVGLV